MIGHDSMNYIVGAALRHMARDAIGGGRVVGRSHVVAGPAGCIIVVRCFLAARNIVRVVAGQTCHRSLALEEAAGLAQTDDGAYDLELRVWLRGAIEEQ